MRISELDVRDHALLRELQHDGRLSNAELAHRVNLSPSACLRRLRLLERSGLVNHYALLLDEAACGLPGTAFVRVTLDRQDRAALDAFESAVAEAEEVMECYLIAGDADYMMRIIYSDAREIERIHTDVLTQFPGVARVQSTLALRTVKKTTAIPLKRP